MATGASRDAGRQGARTSLPATEAKNNFGRALDLAMAGNAVFITKHDVAKAVLLSIDEYEALSRAAARTLDALSGDFDALLARMQSKRSRSGMAAAFGAPPRKLGRAAVKAARTRG